MLLLMFLNVHKEIYTRDWNIKWYFQMHVYLNY